MVGCRKLEFMVFICCFSSFFSISLIFTQFSLLFLAFRFTAYFTQAKATKLFLLYLFYNLLPFSGYLLLGIARVCLCSLQVLLGFASAFSAPYPIQPLSLFWPLFHATTQQLLLAMGLQHIKYLLLWLLCYFGSEQSSIKLHSDIMKY